MYNSSFDAQKSQAQNFAWSGSVTRVNYSKAAEGTETLEPHPVSPGVSIPFWLHPLPSPDQRGVGWPDHRKGCAAESSGVFLTFSCSAMKAARSGDRQDNRGYNLKAMRVRWSLRSTIWPLRTRGSLQTWPSAPVGTSKALGWLIGFSYQRRKQENWKVTTTAGTLLPSGLLVTQKLEKGGFLYGKNFIYYL